MKTKTCTDFEQSKKLISLGIDKSTADLYRDYELIGNTPMWSSSALMDLLPSDFDIKGEFGTFTYKIKIRKYRFDSETNVYQIAYGSYGGSGIWHDITNTP